MRRHLGLCFRFVAGSALCVAATPAAWPAPQTISAFSAQADGAPPAPWQIHRLPLKPETPVTALTIEAVNGSHVLAVRTNRSYGNAVWPWPDAAQAIGKLQWTWRLQQALPRSNLHSRWGDDVALKVCVLFDMPTDKLSLGERMMLAWGRKAAGTKLPSATLCYVWDTQLPLGASMANAFTQRLRYVVVDSGPPRAGWTTHTVDVAADFAKHFGHEYNKLPAVLAIAVGGDSDNTQSASLGFVGDLLLLP